MSSIKSILKQTVESQITGKSEEARVQLVNAIQKAARRLQESMARSFDAANFSHGDSTTATFVDFTEVTVDGSERNLSLPVGDYEFNEVVVSYRVHGTDRPASRYEPEEYAELEFEVIKVTYVQYDEDTNTFSEPVVVDGPEAARHVPNSVLQTIDEQMNSMMRSKTGLFGPEEY